MREREPTARERREVERELAAEEPQDGAELHAAEAADSGERTDEADAESPPAETGESDEQGSSGGYTVSAGSFASEANAQAQVTRLAAMGYHPYVTRIEKDGVTFTRVNVGEYPSRSAAQDVADELRAKGFDAAVYSR